MALKLQPPRTFILEPCDHQQRLDRYLSRCFKTLSKHFIHRLLRTHKVLVNGEKVPPHYRLDLSDQVQLFYSVEERVQPPSAPLLVTGATRDLTSRCQLLHEDDSLLVLNKPSGLAVHGGSGISWGLIEWLRQQKPNAPYLELVHRLDKGTSGIILVAKKRSCLRNLHAQFRDHQIKKSYLALTFGQWPKQKCTIELALNKRTLESGGRFVHSTEAGKPSKTTVLISRQFSEFSELKVYPETGRTHQIRVHLSEFGYPILGDDRYAHKPAKQFCKHHKINRLFLHAQALTCQHPVTGKSLHLTAAVPDEWQAFISRIIHDPTAA